MATLVPSAVEILSANLRAALAQQQRSARDVADQAGLSNATVSNMVRGKHQATVESADRVAAALGFALWQLLCPQFNANAAEQRRAARLLDHWLRSDERGRALIEHAAQLAATAPDRTA